MLKKTSTLRTLDPFLDSDGVMRVGGRIRKATLSESLKNPVILPKSSHITALVISYAHERTHHSGRGITLNELRASGYWIFGGNSMVRQFISKCVTCRYLRGTVGEQKMADLPKSCVKCLYDDTNSLPTKYTVFKPKMAQKQNLFDIQIKLYYKDLSYYPSIYFPTISEKKNKINKLGPVCRTVTLL